MFQRIQQNLLSKMCLCPFNTTDEQKCQSFEDSKLTLIKDSIEIKCQYGYFEFESECIKCPSIIHSIIVSCLECLQNTLTWSEQPYCSLDICLSQQGTTQDEFFQLSQYFLLDGLEIYFLLNLLIFKFTQLLRIKFKFLDELLGVQIVLQII